MQKTGYILRAVDVIGTVTYYTGKAGIDFVSERPSDAFGYETLAGARRKAVVLNRMANGWIFYAVGYVPEHGVVPAETLEQFTPTRDTTAERPYMFRQG